MQNQYLISIVGSILIDNIYNSLLFHALGIVKLRDYLKQGVYSSYLLFKQSAQFYTLEHALLL